MNELTQEEIKLIIQLLEGISLPVGQTERIVLPILVKLRAKLAETTSALTKS